MADDRKAVFRALAVVQLPDGREVVLSKLGLADWATIQERALDLWKEREIRQREEALERAMQSGRLVELRERELKEAEERLAVMEPESLPRKMTAVPVPKKGKPGEAETGNKHECEKCGVVWGVLPETPAERVICPACLMAGGVKRAAGEAPAVEVREVDYPIWWLSNTAKGRLFATWLSMRKTDAGLTLEDADALWAGAGEQALESAANKVGEISTPTLGN